MTEADDEEKRRLVDKAAYGAFVTIGNPQTHAEAKARAFALGGKM